MSIANTSPHERLFTVHFTALGQDDASFDSQMPTCSIANLDRSFRQVTHIHNHALRYRYPNDSDPGTIRCNDDIIGHFTITPPTLKDDPGEPT